MKTFKILKSTGKKGSRTKSTCVRAENIADAMDISRKLNGTLISIVPITQEEFSQAINAKYTHVAKIK